MLSSYMDGYLDVLQGIQKPAWLEALNTQKFFVGCLIHESAKKNEKNICCLDCCTSICPHCLPSHRFHRLVQVRRYVYHDVVRLEDIERLIDCSNVQVIPIEGEFFFLFSLFDLILKIFQSFLPKAVVLSCILTDTMFSILLYLLQAYTINSAKVVFIKKRPQSRQFKGSGNYCTSCDRCLQEPYIHCSLGCKVLI